MGPLNINVIREKQIDSSPLADKNIAVIGYGSQGRAQALNLRDNGYDPIVGLPVKSRSRRFVRQDGINFTTPAKAVKKADIIVILIPDHKHKELFERDIDKAIKREQTFIFAHALSVHFKLIKQPTGVDFVLVAPHGPGLRLRERFKDGKGITAFIGRTDDSSKDSLKTAAAYAKAIGCARAGLMITDFADEAIGDIFGEQAVLCGGLSALLKAGFDSLVKSGISPENAYLECVYQLDLIVDLIKKFGIHGMYEKISTTAALGGLAVESEIINKQSRGAMQSILDKIVSGKFTDELMADYGNSFARLKKYQKQRRNRILDDMAVLFDKKFSD
ncbi:MAG: ketol-acid reductoisomerase [candidate division Zixibacteria bacterium]|nr:ketol-acid reductoisomerase [candidate division Zixibacteria bacterium]